MTDAFSPIDAGLWSLAVGLLALALWLSRSRGEWDPAVFFAGVLSASFGKGKLPLLQGPVPDDGWEGTPADLDPVYDPRDRLGPELSWDALVEWDEATCAAVRRRLANVTLVWLEPPPFAVPEVRVCVVDGEADPLAAIGDLLPRPESRLVLAAHSQADAALQLLHGAPALRDRVRAVLLYAPSLDAEWIALNLTHRAFDTELRRDVPFLTLREGADADGQVLPTPPTPPDGRRSVASIDLGVASPGLVADLRLGRALAALFAALG